MELPSRCALIGIPASASPVGETTLPARSETPSAASVALGATKVQAAAMAAAVNAVPTKRFAFIAVTFLRCAGTRGPTLRLLPFEMTMIRLPRRGFNVPKAQSVAPVAVDHVLQRNAELDAIDLPQHVDHDRIRHRLRGVVRRDRHLGMIPERARDRQRLDRKHVERGARQRALLERG